MKRFILLLTILYPFCLLAQDDDYRPFIEEGKVWVSGFHGQIYPSNAIQYYIVYDYFDGDTIVNGVECKRWREDFVPRDNAQQSSQHYTMAVYEENGKVWLFHDGETTAKLIYDFKAAPGNTVIVFSALAYSYLWARNHYGKSDDFFRQANDTLTILSRKTELLGGRTQDVIYYTSQRLDSRRESFEECIIEGIGSSRGPFDNLAYGGRTSPIYLVYCMIGDEILYFNEESADYWNIPLPTSIAAPRSDSTISSWHTLSGHRLSSPPTRKGVYIRDGKKVVVK